MTAPSYETTRVPVDGGELFVGIWGPAGAPVVLAAHGITGNHLQMAPLAHQLPEFRVVAPDLRGRGQSADLPGPYGMRTHARDLVAVLDHLGVDRAIAVGASMGGYAVAVMAADRPDRVERLVLVDGGLTLGIAAPPEDIDAVLDAIIGPAVARLSMTFESIDAHRDFWKAHPALADDWSPLIEASVDYDLVGQAPELHSRVSHQAVREDGAANLADEAVFSAIDRSQCPIDLLRAEKGMFDQPPGLFTDEAVVPFRARLGSRFHDECVAGVNHYTICLSERGAKRVAEVVRSGLG